MKKIFFIYSALFLFACGASKKSETLTPLGKEQHQSFAENETTPPPGDERLLVYNAYLTLKVKEQEGVSEKINAIAKKMGGYILDLNESRVRFRVLKDSLEVALSASAKLGEVIHQEINGMDVTEQHTDLSLRLDNAKQSRQRYLHLLEKAEKVSDILLIEKELERLLYTIEKLQGQINKLDETIAFSTVTISIQEKVRPGPLGWVFVGLYKAVKFLFVWD